MKQNQVGEFSNILPHQVEESSPSLSISESSSSPPPPSSYLDLTSQGDPPPSSSPSNTRQSGLIKSCTCTLL